MFAQVCSVQVHDVNAQLLFADAAICLTHCLSCGAVLLRLQLLCGQAAAAATAAAAGFACNCRVFAACSPPACLIASLSMRMYTMRNCTRTLACSHAIALWPISACSMRMNAMQLSACAQSIISCSTFSYFCHAYRHNAACPPFFCGTGCEL